MPRLANLADEKTAQSFNTQFQFSFQDISSLGATEYTLATTVVDASSSVSPFEKDLVACLKASAESLKKSPRSENLLVRMTQFANKSQELHGFRELKHISISDYDTILHVGGNTALYDGCLDAIEATRTMGDQLQKMDYIANAVIFIITDGQENHSSLCSSADAIKKAIQETMQAEKLESITTILIGIGSDPSVMHYLENFKKEAGITQFVMMGDASPSNLAKLAAFMSKSTSSASQALGTGQPSQLLNF